MQYIEGGEASKRMRDAGREGARGGGGGGRQEERECDRVVTERESGALCVSGLCVSLCSCP